MIWNIIKNSKTKEIEKIINEKIDEGTPIVNGKYSIWEIAKKKKVNLL